MKTLFRLTMNKIRTVPRMIARTMYHMETLGATSGRSTSTPMIEGRLFHSGFSSFLMRYLSTMNKPDTCATKNKTTSATVIIQLCFIKTLKIKTFYKCNYLSTLNILKRRIDQRMNP